MPVDHATQIAAQNWQGLNLSFWLITILVISSGAVAAFARNIVQAAFSLFFTLLGVAGYYILLGSAFLAVTQVVIYVGGILVLLIFGVLLTNRPLERAQTGMGRMYFVGGLLGLALLLGVLYRVITGTSWVVSKTFIEPGESLRPMGRLLLTDYVLPFELAGVTLLLCLIGAAYLVRRRER
ncbi:MAG: NADH-quinone oxidoreductase subunit J [bacterium]|nr:NADH-quinone oxidoreductase subunit J [bacterium]